MRTPALRIALAATLTITSQAGAGEIRGKLPQATHEGQTVLICAREPYAAPSGLGAWRMRQFRVHSVRTQDGRLLLDWRPDYFFGRADFGPCVDSPEGQSQETSAPIPSYHSKGVALRRWDRNSTVWWCENGIIRGRMRDGSPAGIPGFDEPCKVLPAPRR
jgi:hypothetical protein